MDKDVGFFILLIVAALLFAGDPSIAESWRKQAQVAAECKQVKP